MEHIVDVATVRDCKTLRAEVHLTDSGDKKTVGNHFAMNDTGGNWMSESFSGRQGGKEKKQEETEETIKTSECSTAQKEKREGVEEGRQKGDRSNPAVGKKAV